jgi:hypothetical protein
MKNLKNYGVVVGFFLISLSGHAANSNKMVICKNQKTVRTVRIWVDPATQFCVTSYSKMGVEKEVGRAQTMASCEKVMSNIKTNLISASWQCKDIEGVGLTSNENASTSGTAASNAKREPASAKSL